ncbi:MAG: glutamate-1-semialdehyde 2,1-aminomutase [Thermoplasmata archaeon]
MTRAGPRSRAAFRRAERSLAGGVDSPVRAFGAVGGTPLFFARGRGAYLWDVDGRRYLDLLGSWGASILGHAPPGVVRAVRACAARGLTFGAPSELEHALAERIRAAAPVVERLRFVSSGTEAVMSAVRVARGFTRRPKVLKFAGGYHGHSDGLLARAGSGVATGSLPDSAGVPDAFVAQTLVAPYNDAKAVARLMESHGEEVAAVVVEPVAGNMNVVPPAPGFLSALERECRRHGALLIADEVITGFRVGRGLAHPRYGVRADLVTLGKVIGGGLPVGAYGGRADVMELVSPSGPVYQAGTLSGNPVVMAAGAATLDALTPATYRALERVSRDVARALVGASEEAGDRAFHLTRVGSMLGLFFGPAAPTNLEEALRVDRAAYARFFGAMLSERVYLPPSPLETAFVSTAFREPETGRLARAARNAFRAGAPGP